MGLRFVPGTCIALVCTLSVLTKQFVQAGASLPDHFRFNSRKISATWSWILQFFVFWLTTQI